MSDHECHPGLRNSSWGQSGLLGGIRVYAGAAEARGNWVPHVYVPVPQESRESALVGSKKGEFDGIWPCKRSVGPWMCGHTWGSAERIGSALRECPALSVTRTKGVSVRELGQGLQTLCHCLREACM